MAFFGLNANLPPLMQPLPGQMQMPQTPLAQHMAMGGQLQAPGLDMGSGPAAGDMLNSLRAAMAAAAPRQGLAPTSATPPAASTTPTAASSPLALSERPPGAADTLTVGSSARPGAAPAGTPTWDQLIAHAASIGALPQGMQAPIQAGGAGLQNAASQITNPIMALLSRLAPNGVLGQ